MTMVSVDMKWFYYSQNNSGGSFVVNDSVSVCVFIQAPNARMATSRAEEILDNSDSCECCGDRWSIYYMDDSDGYDEPTIYNELMVDLFKDAYRRSARLHYFDGKVESYKFKEQV